MNETSTHSSPSGLLYNNVEVKYHICDILILVWQVSFTVGTTIREYRTNTSDGAILIVSLVFMLILETLLWLFAVNVLTRLAIKSTWQRALGQLVPATTMAILWLVLLPGLR